MVTQYPSKIDDNTSLPQVADLASIFSAEVYNRLRNAIIAIETELGAKPSASYGSVKNRFDVLEDSFGNIQIIALDNDLGGTLNSPKVIGLQGRPITTTAPTSGQLLSWNGASWSPTHITNANVASGAAIDYSKFGTGTQLIGAQQFNSTVDGYGTIKDVQPKNVQTTDATVTTLDSFTIPNNTVLIVNVIVTAIKSDNTQGACYLRRAAFRNTSGTVTQIGVTQDGGTFEDDNTWDTTIDNSTTTIRIRVTGKNSTTIRWTCVSSRLEVIAA